MNFKKGSLSYTLYPLFLSSLTLFLSFFLSFFLQENIRDKNAIHPFLSRKQNENCLRQTQRGFIAFPMQRKNGNKFFLSYLQFC
jgi:hypothetical protein